MFDNPEERRGAFTDRQIELLRSLMDDYYEVQHHGPMRATWGGICDEIEGETGTLMDEEVLRQWVKRVRRRDVPRIPSSKNLEKIASFLEKMGLLDMEELEELAQPRVPHLLSRKFLEYFRTRDRAELISIPQSILGKYRAVTYVNRRTIVVNITVNVDDIRGCVYLDETEESYDSFLPPPQSTDDLWTAHSQYIAEVRRNSRLKTTRTSTGWGVITPENTLLIFMKDEEYGENHFYISAAWSGSIWKGRDLKTFALLRYDRPLEFTEFDFMKASRVRSYIGTKVLVFVREDIQIPTGE